MGLRGRSERILKTSGLWRREQDCFCVCTTGFRRWSLDGIARVLRTHIENIRPMAVGAGLFLHISTMGFRRWSRDGIAWALRAHIENNRPVAAGTGLFQRTGDGLSPMESGRDCAGAHWQR